MQRVSDPYGVVSGKLISKCEKQIENGMAVLAISPESNGNPLLFAHISGKSHILDGRDEKKFGTAATNGKSFFWYPQFLASCSGLQVVTILKHEGYHNLLCHPEQMSRVEYPRAFNIAADFIVNSVVEREWKASSYGIKNPDPNNHPLWRAPLGKPITLEELKELFKTNKESLLKSINSSLNKIKEKKELKSIDDKKNNNLISEETADKEKQDIKEKFNSKENEVKEDDVKEGIKYTLVDDSILGKSAMDIYNEIKDWYKSLDDDLKKLLENFITDEHIPGCRSEKEALEEVLRCGAIGKQMRGSVPAEIEAQLQELTNPTLDLNAFTEQTIKANKRDGGNKASYVRFKRRFIGDERFYPRYMTPTSRILVLLDTSGSMSDEDIALGVSELQQFIGKADIYIVPVDAAPHWDSITKVSKNTDFKSVKIIGRGGTEFSQFFRDYRAKTRKYGMFNSIIVISDGYVDKVPSEYAPHCPVGWVVTSTSHFDQNFGTPIYLKR